MCGLGEPKMVAGCVTYRAFGGCDLEFSDTIKKVQSLVPFLGVDNLAVIFSGNRSL